MENKPILSNQQQPTLAPTENSDATSSPSSSHAACGTKKKCALLKKKRHILALYAFFGYFFAYSIRANLSVAIVEMAKRPHIDLAALTTTTTKATQLSDAVASQQNATISVAIAAGNNSTSPNSSFVTSTSHDAIVSVNEQWSPVMQGYILSSFFYGYIVTQLPAAFLTSKYGGRFYFGMGIGICSLLSLLIPLAARFGPWYIMFIRILQGLSQGFIFPAMHCMWSKWAPPSERSRLATFSLSGSYIGSVVALSLGGIIGEALSWPWIFYFFGLCGMIWTYLWFSNIFESPSQHETISQEEKLLIESSLVMNDNTKIPWSSILKSSAVYAIVVAHFAENWGFYTMLTEMPTFLSGIMKYKIDKAGILSSFPYLIMALVLYFSGHIADLLVQQRNMSYTHVRKLFCCVGFLVQALFMFMMALSYNAYFLVICVTFAIGFGGMPWSSFGVNHLDIGAGYANVLMAYSNTFASLPGIISPVLTGYLITQKTKEEWNAVFCISAIVYFLGAVVYGLIGTGETQPWAIRADHVEIGSIEKRLEVDPERRRETDNFAANSAFTSDEPNKRGLSTTETIQ